MTIKKEPITLKDVLLGIIGVLITIIGFFINRELSQINNSIKEFKDFQLEQKVNTQRIDGELKLLNAQDISLEGRISKLERRK